MRINDVILNGLKQMNYKVLDYRLTLVSFYVVKPYDIEGKVTISAKYSNQLNEVWIVQAVIKNNSGYVLLEETKTSKGETPF